MKRHHHVLYGLVFILLILEVISFVTLTSQVSKVTQELEKNSVAQEQAMIELQHAFQRNLSDVEVRQQKTVQELAQEVTLQQSSVSKEITLLKSAQGDFSGILEGMVKSVVSVVTDKSMGSGFFIAADGYVVTNQHVIAGAQKIVVLTYDKKTIPAVVMGSDFVRDVALLKIQGNYDALPLADSDSLQVGKKVVAIGNPLGLSFTVTEGIISALHRKGPSGLEEYIQTDVSLNPGNSGGPLIDTSGHVIGLNNFKVGGAENLGFALESNAIREALHSISNLTIAQ